MWADPDADYDKIGKLQAELEDKIAATDAWSLERNVDIAMDALRCPPDDADVTHAVGRREAPRRAVPSAAVAAPTSCCSTSRPTTSTPNRCSGSNGSCRTTPAPSSRSPTTATSSTTSPSGSSNSTTARASRSKATTRRGWSRRKNASPRTRSRTSPAGARLQRELEWVKMSPKARQAKGKARLAAYDKLQAEAEAVQDTEQQPRDRDPPGPASRRHGHRGRRPEEGLRRQAPHRRPVVLAASGRDRRDHRRQRRRQDDPVPHADGSGANPTPARSRSARPCSSPTSTSRATTSTPTRRSTRRSPRASST